MNVFHEQVGWEVLDLPGKMQQCHLLLLGRVSGCQ